jgi:hypothetical protein
MNKMVVVGSTLANPIFRKSEKVKKSRFQKVGKVGKGLKGPGQVRSGLGSYQLGTYCRIILLALVPRVNLFIFQYYIYRSKTFYYFEYVSL